MGVCLLILFKFVLLAIFLIVPFLILTFRKGYAGIFVSTLVL